MKFLVLFCIFFGVQLSAKDEISLEKKIASLFMMGYPKHDIYDMQYDVIDGVGGVLFFGANITSKLRQDIKSLKQISNKIIIAVDQEGGKVQRLNSSNGYKNLEIPSAKSISKMTKAQTIKIYENLAKNLSELGINCNLAPVLDLSINKNNKVIVQKDRSYGRYPYMVGKFGQMFIQSHHKYGVLTTLKHFPGHGSSNEDSHKSITNITKTWKYVELKPYVDLIQNTKIDMIMIGHLINKKLFDDRCLAGAIKVPCPAVLSKTLVTKVLKNTLKYKGVVISDDMQMSALDMFTLRQKLTYGFNAGIDFFIFANQVLPKDIITLHTLVQTTISLINEGKISMKIINKAYIKVGGLVK
jgi:beta-N-acetylhexosaminidase